MEQCQEDMGDGEPIQCFVEPNNRQQLDAYAKEHYHDAGVNGDLDVDCRSWPQPVAGLFLHKTCH